MHDERHPLDPFSLAAGVVFAAVAVLGLAGLLTGLDAATLRWLVPGTLVAVGLAVVLGALRDRDPARAAHPGEDE